MAAPENNVRELTLKRQEMKSKKRYCLEDDKKVNHRVVIFIVEPGMSRQGIIHREPGYNIILRAITGSNERIGARRSIDGSH